MTISKTVCRHDYVGNGALLVYPYDFYIGAAAELLVYVSGVLKALGVDYTVSGAGGTEAGGNVTFLLASVPAVDAPILILRATSVTQATDLNPSGTFYEADVEAMSDKVTRIIQELQEILGRALKLPATSLLSGLSVPEPVAGQMLVWKDDLTGLRNVLSSATISLGGGYDFGPAPPAEPSARPDNFIRFNTAFEPGGNFAWVRIGGQWYETGFVSANPV